MPGRVKIAILSALLLAGCDGHWGARSFAYKLHSPQNDGQYSSLHSMPDGSLLMLSKQFAQPKQVWNLLRITDWDTAHPREDRLAVDVGANDDGYGQLNGGARYDRNDQLLMDPGGNYLVVRLSPDLGSGDLNSDASAKPQRNVLNIIDLHAFKLVRRVEITDPLLAAGDMGFSPKGTFLVSGLQKRSSATNGGYVNHTGQFVVETLSLPGLEPQTLCSYTMVEKAHSAQKPSPAEENKQIEKEDEEETDREQNQRQAANDACAPKLAPLGFSSLEEVFKAFNSWGQVRYEADYTMHIPADALGPWGCGVRNLSADRKYEIADCDQAHVVVFGRYRAYRIFRLEDGKLLLDLKVPRSPLFGDRQILFSGVLAERRGVSYVVLLRDGAELEGYRVPTS